MTIADIAKQAKAASILLAAVKTDIKNKALAEIAKGLKANSAEIIKANLADLAKAEKKRRVQKTLRKYFYRDCRLEKSAFLHLAPTLRPIPGSILPWLANGPNPAIFY